MAKIGIIGGSGVYDIPGLTFVREVIHDTPFGKPSDSFKVYSLSGEEILFLPRHGSEHTFPPHKVNYRANIWGFRDLGVKRIVSIGAAGGINSSFNPGDIVLPDQIIDKTVSRVSSFYEEGRVVHVDFTEPYCDELRRSFMNASHALDIPVYARGTYVCTEGPRLESKAEIQYFSIIGADIVGMTGMPEACLARELELCYAGIVIVTNHAAGIGARKLSVTEVMETMKRSTGPVKRLLFHTLSHLPEERGCSCKEALRDSTP